ncbi:MAG TPA: ornithine cyclodeaminase family protein [Kofleriaceae bacterium]|nr:ornithine cyclodeaminase family protein [Kofleriaceae bacterium]
MDTLVIGGDEVRRLLPMAECVDVMAQALGALASADAMQPLRAVLRLPSGAGYLVVMPAYVGGALDAPGVKVITVFPGNFGSEIDSHQGAVLLFEGERGRLAAVIDASEVTAIRTAAVSGLATRLLAREEAGDLALLGTGVQARSHLAAMAAVRRLRRVRVWSRDLARASAFAGRAAAEHPGCEISAAASAREAVSGADLVCTTTASNTPVLEGAWLAAGAHVNAVGACLPTARELDGAAVARARTFVDRRESALNEAGDLLLARAEGAIGDDHIAGEIGELVIGAREGRRSPDEITLFKSLGLAIEDIAAAHYIHARARKEGAGAAIELGGSRDPAAQRTTETTTETTTERTRR